MIESNSPNLRKIYFLLEALMNDLPFNNLSFFITLIKTFLHMNTMVLGAIFTMFSVIGLI